MERFTNNQNVNEYDYLSKYYDDLLNDEEGWEIWLKYINEYEYQSVLELASGSGFLASILKKNGKDVICSDINESMKIASLKNFDGEYLILDMKDYHLNKKFDLILCLCDSFNYLKEDEIDSFLKCAYEHLNDKGHLIFDMHHIERLNEFKEDYIEEGYVLNTPYLWNIKADLIDSTIIQHFTFYTNEGMIHENHIQNIYDISSIKEKMLKYFNVGVIEDFIENEKVLMIGEKL